MKQLQKTLLSGMFIFVLSIFLGGFPVEAAPSVKKMCDLTAKNTTFSADITGDNKKDTISLKFTLDDENNYVEKLRVYVNGKKALTLQEKDYYYHVDATYIQMSKTKQFLQITGRGDNDYCTFNSIYRYDTKAKKLVRVLDLSSNYLLTDGIITKATSKNIVIRHTYQPSETGLIHWKYTYVYKNNKFVLNSGTANVRSSLGTYDFGDGYDKYFAKNQFVVARSLRFYTDTKLNKTSFTAKKNDVLTLKKMKTNGTKLYLQFQKGSKTGWRRVNVKSYMEEPFFFGVNNRLAG